jgi:murein DD-endopeptidase MepM/ murein hydrolase activator NlpD
MLFFLGLAFLALRRRIEWPKEGWLWPVPGLKSYDGELYDAVISDGVGTARPGGQEHRGVDILYQRKGRTDRPEYKPGTSDGTSGFFAPRNTPIIAARGGIVWSVSNTPRGWSVVLDHGKPWATYYTHLESSSLPEHRNGVSVSGKVTAIKAGDIVGYMGADPMDPSHLRHLHFAVWNGGGEESAVDPEDAMRTWPRAPWRQTPPAPKVS